jgi:hypothetical protein
MMVTNELPTNATTSVVSPAIDFVGRFSEPRLQEVICTLFVVMALSGSWDLYFGSLSMVQDLNLVLLLQQLLIRWQSAKSRVGVCCIYCGRPTLPTKRIPLVPVSFVQMLLIPTTTGNSL